MLEIMPNMLNYAGYAKIMPSYAIMLSYANYASYARGEVTPGIRHRLYDRCHYHVHPGILWVTVESGHTRVKVVRAY